MSNNQKKNTIKRKPIIQTQSSTENTNNTTPNQQHNDCNQHTPLTNNFKY